MDARKPLEQTPEFDLDPNRPVEQYAKRLVERRRGRGTVEVRPANPFAGDNPRAQRALELTMDRHGGRTEPLLQLRGRPRSRWIAEDQSKEMCLKLGTEER